MRRGRTTATARRHRATWPSRVTIAPPPQLINTGVRRTRRLGEHLCDADNPDRSRRVALTRTGAIVPAVSDLFAGTEPEVQAARPRPRVVIYTDGACKRNPEGPGGWGVVLSSGLHLKELHGRSTSTTNNRMELTAVIEASTP
jgi:RNase H